MVNNFTNINKAINSHIKSLNIEKTIIYDIENSGSDYGWTQIFGVIKPVMAITTLILLVIGSPIAIQI